MAVAIWHIWENKNAYHNGEALVPPYRLVSKIKAYIEFINLYSLCSTKFTSSETLKSIQKWSSPPEVSMLVNVDASIFSHSARMGFGVVICDHQGKLQVASRGYFERVQVPEIAEAMALRQALFLAKEIGVQKILVASDYLSLISKIKDSGLDRSPT